MEELESEETIENNEEIDRKIKKHKIKQGAKKSIKRIMALIIVIAMIFATSATLIFYLMNNIGK